MPYDCNDDGYSQEPVIPCGFLKLDEIAGETQTKWLWADKVPLGQVTIVAGEASSGKSLLAAEIAAPCFQWRWLATQRHKVRSLQSRRREAGRRTTNRLGADRARE